ncbi:hypothetical protein MXB_3728 [Myxobolus squamalis]|nr:hypothetical protein MXB_3728 [Myxobolus squamalis]
MASHSLSNKTDESMKCRVFIGNLPTESVNKDSIQAIFSQYGSYVDCSIYKNYGFVQFNDETSANNAVQGTNKTMMFDRRLDVKIATVGRKEVLPDRYNNTGRVKKRNFNPNEVNPLMSRQPYDPGMHYQPPQVPQPYHIPPQNYDPYQVANAQGPYYTPVERTARASEEINPNHSAPDISESRYCEIICTSKKQLPYAEFIEFTIARLGFSCNINILSSNYSPEILLNRASNDGVPIAISLKDENEGHRSINLHIFSGIPEEHRNMPIDVAESFIKKKFTNQSQPSGIPMSSMPSQLPTTRSFSYSTNMLTNQAVISSTALVPATLSMQPVHGAVNYSYPSVYPAVPYYPGYRPLVPDTPFYQIQNPGYSHVGANASLPQISQYMPLPAVFKRG